MLVDIDITEDIVIEYLINRSLKEINKILDEIEDYKKIKIRRFGDGFLPITLEQEIKLNEFLKTIQE